MFKVKRFRKIVMNYEKIYSANSKLVGNNSDYYLNDLRKLLKLINYQLGNAYIILGKCCNFQIKLSAKPKTIFWFFIQKIVDYLYDETLYSIEELTSCKNRFNSFKLLTYQTKIYSVHDK